MKIKVIILLAILLIVFVLQNTETVNVNFIFWDLSFLRALLLFVCFAVGLIFGLLIPSSRLKKEADAD